MSAGDDLVDVGRPWHVMEQKDTDVLTLEGKHSVFLHTVDRGKVDGWFS